MEPLTKIYINCPEAVMGDALRELQQRRGTIEDIHQEGEATIIAAKGTGRRDVRIRIRHPRRHPGTRSLVHRELWLRSSAERNPDQGRGRDQDPKGTKARAVRRCVLFWLNSEQRLNTKNGMEVKPNNISI